MRVYDVMRLSEIRERVVQLHVAGEYNDDLDFLLEMYDSIDVTEAEVEELREEITWLKDDVDEAESNATCYEDDLACARNELEDLKDELTGFVDSFRNGKIDEEQIKKWEEQF